MEYLPLLRNVRVKLHEHFKRNSKFLFSQNCLNYLTVRSCVRGQNTEISVTGALKYDSNVCAAQQYSAQSKDYYYYYYKKLHRQSYVKPSGVDMNPETYLYNTQTLLHTSQKTHCTFITHNSWLM